MKKIIFTVKISRFGKAKMLIIYIPRAIRQLVTFGKEYKITLEEIKSTEAEMFDLEQKLDIPYKNRFYNRNKKNAN